MGREGKREKGERKRGRKGGIEEGKDELGRLFQSQKECIFCMFNIA